MSLPVTLKVGGSEIDLDAKSCEVLALRRGYSAPFSLTLRRAIAHDDTDTWENEDTVELLTDDGTTRFVGRIKANERSGSVSAESVTYICLGVRNQVNDHTFRRSVSGAVVSRVVYNCPETEEEQEAGYVALTGRQTTVGEIIDDILDTMKSDLSGTVGTGTLVSMRSEADIAGMTAIPGKIVLDAMPVDEAIAAVLAHQPDRAHYIDPETRRYVFVDLENLAATDVAGVDGAVIRQSLNFTTGPCYGACTVEGTRELHDCYDGSLTPAWDTSLEADWTLLKRLNYPDTYGKVFRYFHCNKAAANGGVVMPSRIVGDGTIITKITIEFWDPVFDLYLGCNYYYAKASYADDSHILVNFIVRQGKASGGAGTEDGTTFTQEWETPNIGAWYTYGKDPVSGRYPTAAGTYEGTAYTARGLEREKYITQEERTRAVMDVTIKEVVSAKVFRIDYPIGSLLKRNELAGMKMTVNGGAQVLTIVGNRFGGHNIEVEQDPSPPLAVDDEVEIVIRDDTEVLAGETLTILQLYAKAFVDRYGDEQYNGTVPMSGLDWDIGLGQKINFTGTDNAAYASLGAALVEVTHDIGVGQMALTLTNERSGPESTWREIDERRRLAREAEEAKTQIRRLWLKVRRRESDAADSNRTAGGDDDEDDTTDHRTKVRADGRWLKVNHWKQGDRIVYQLWHDVIELGEDEATVGDTAGAGQKFNIIHIDRKNHVIKLEKAVTLDAISSGDDWIDLDGPTDGTTTIEHGVSASEHHTEDTGAGYRFDQLSVDEKNHVLDSTKTATIDTATADGDAWINCAVTDGNLVVTHKDASTATQTWDTRTHPVGKFDAKGHLVEAQSSIIAFLGDGAAWPEPLPHDIPMGPENPFEIT